MNVIPEKYDVVHKEHQKFINSQNHDYLDQYFYKIEKLFIFPNFKDLKETRKMVRFFYEAKDSSQLKQKVSAFIKSRLSLHEIDIDEFEKIKVRFNKTQKKQRSYYNKNSRTISISEFMIIDSVKNKDMLTELLYTLLHEIAHAHAYSKKPFCSGHGFVFLHSLNTILSAFSLGCFFFSEWTSKKIECHDGVFRDFNEYCQHDGIFYPLTTDFISSIFANTVEEVISIANRLFNGNIVLPVDENGVSEYEACQKRKETFVINKGHIFNEYSISVSRRKNGVVGFVLKEREFFESSQQFYINFLKNKYEEKRILS